MSDYFYKNSIMLGRPAEDRDSFNYCKKALINDAKSKVISTSKASFQKEEYYYGTMEVLVIKIPISKEKHIELYGGEE